MHTWMNLKRAEFILPLKITLWLKMGQKSQILKKKNCNKICLQMLFWYFVIKCIHTFFSVQILLGPRSYHAGQIHIMQVCTTLVEVNVFFDSALESVTLQEWASLNSLHYQSWRSILISILLPSNQNTNRTSVVL